MPTGEELERAYEGWYRPASGRFVGPGDAVLRRTRGRLARRLDRIAPPGRILDVGAGDGVLLDALAARGRDAVGIERRASRPDVLELDVTEVEGGLAAIVFWHSLEHLPRARRALDHAASILDDDGVLVIAIPNPASVQARLFGDRWLALDLPRHLVHVPASSLLARLERLGLRVERVSYLRGGQVTFGWLHGLVGMLPGHPDLYDAIRRPEARAKPLSPAAQRSPVGAGPCTLRRDVSERAEGKVAVVMPALNAAATIASVVGGIPRDWVDEIVVVDDGSTDETVSVARDLDVRVVWHPHNAGYGANQKTCYLDALQREADVVVMLHPDGQYPPDLIPDLIRPILAGEADMVLGSRMMIPGAARAGGMPRYKRIANRILTRIENRIMGTELTDLHTGYRAYSRRLLLGAPFLRNANDFSFDSEMLMQASELGYRITEVPASTRYFSDASSVGFGAGSVYGLKTLWAGTRLLLHRRGIWPSRKYKG